MMDNVLCLRSFHIPALSLFRSVLKKILTYDGVTRPSNYANYWYTNINSKHCLDLSGFFEAVLCKSILE